MEVDFNHSWKPKNENSTAHSVSLTDKVNIRETLTSIHTASTERGIYLVGKFDTNSFKINSDLVEKSFKDDSLKKSLEFYSEEVVDSKRPLYGIFKAIEILTKTLGKKYNENGKKVLAEMTGENRKFVEDLMQSTQLQRHAITPAKKILSDKECIQRAKKLILAYADSIK